jgi:CheY-like chemotaxis protein
MQALRRILYVGTRTHARHDVVDALVDLGCEVHLCHGLHDAIQSAVFVDPQAVIVDVSLPDDEGYGIVAGLRQIGLPGPPVFIALARHLRDLEGAHAGLALFDDWTTHPLDAGKLRMMIEGSMSATC